LSAVWAESRASKSVGAGCAIITDKQQRGLECCLSKVLLKGANSRVG
jgi:hypothetical protein